MVNSKTRAILQKKLGYSNNIYNLIDEFLMVSKASVHVNKMKLNSNFICKLFSDMHKYGKYPSAFEDHIEFRNYILKSLGLYY